MSNANESGEDTRNAELFDPDDPEYQKQLWRPPDIEQDVKEMERRKRVEIIMNSLAAEFDNELLISLVRTRPILYNKYSDMNKSQRNYRNAWNEVCSLLIGEFETMTEATKNAIRQAVTRRWTNIRNSYAKYLRKVQSLKKGGSEEGFKQIKPYIYHDLLDFLSKQYDSRETDSMEPTSGLVSRDASESMERKWEEETSDSEELILPKITSTMSIQPSASRKRHKPTEKETSKVTLMPFFESMMPYLNKFDDGEILEFQMGVLQVIKNINEKRKRGPPAPCYPQYHMIPATHSSAPHYIAPAVAPATYSQFISSTSSTSS